MPAADIDLSLELLAQVNARIAEIQANYDNNRVEFKVGDLVYVVASSPVLATIDLVQDFSKGGKLPGGLVYYWITRKTYRPLWWHPLFAYYKRLRKQVWLPPDCDGHAVLAGESFFRTALEAQEFEILDGLRYYLNDYLSLTRKIYNE